MFWPRAETEGGCEAVSTAWGSRSARQDDPLLPSRPDAAGYVTRPAQQSRAAPTRLLGPPTGARSLPGGAKGRSQKCRCLTVNPRVLGFPGAGDIEDCDTVPPDPRPHLSGIDGIDEIDYQNGSFQGLREADRQGRPSGGDAPREDQSAVGIPDVPLRPLRRLPGERLPARVTAP